MRTKISGLIFAFVLFSGAFTAQGAGLGGVHLFLDLQTAYGGLAKKHGAAVSLDEMLLRRDKFGTAGIFCDARIDGYDYYFWIESGLEPDKNEHFLFTFRQQKGEEVLHSGAGNISTERITLNNILHVFSSAAPPKLYMSVWATAYPDVHGSRFPFNSYEKLNCRPR